MPADTALKTRGESDVKYPAAAIPCGVSFTDLKDDAQLIGFEPGTDVAHDPSQGTWSVGGTAYAYDETCVIRRHTTRMHWTDMKTLTSFMTPDAIDTVLKATQQIR